ncbi:MAG: DUF2237 domain-containing protein [Oleiphilaceae bacterium]|nr:DUF2237 domain-containing protein [Oleiphilaceae bacterium]
MTKDSLEQYPSKNVLGSELRLCSSSPMTGFYRDGHCNTCQGDHGVHTVCCKVTKAFLEFSRFRGNDLSTPRPEFGFHGLKEGDNWCLCAGRWLEAYEEGMAPKVHLLATHERTLELVPLDVLKRFAVDLH